MTQDRQMTEAVKQLLNVFAAFATFSKTEDDLLYIDMHFMNPDGSISHGVIFDHVEGRVHVRHSKLEYAVYKTPEFQAFCRSIGIEPERQRVRIQGCYPEQVYVDFIHNQTSDKPRERTYFGVNEWGAKFFVQKEFVTHHETCHICQQTICALERDRAETIQAASSPGWAWVTD
jgi:hypothetical protein